MAVESILLRGGSVYSPVDPFATAMLVHGDRVAWVGQDGAADASRTEDTLVVDLRGALVTPAFVDAWDETRTGESALARTGVVRSTSAEGRLVVAAGDRDAAELTLLINEQRGKPSARSELYLYGGELDALVEAVGSAKGGWDGVARRKPVLVAPVPGRVSASTVEAVSDLGVTIVVTADQEPVAGWLPTLVKGGARLALGSGRSALGPWDVIRQMADGPAESHLTVRSAFNAQTRGGWRALGVDDAGALVPGALAHFSIWDVTAELVVQAPDERVAAWSTDPRAGVPGLPPLAADADPPRCRATAVAGRWRYGPELD